MRTVFLTGPTKLFEQLELIANLLEREEFRVIRPDRILTGTGADWTGTILSEIKRCDLFVAVLASPSPNVLFELGCAIGCGKAVLVVCGDGFPIPFDIASFPAIEIPHFDERSALAIVDRIRIATFKPRADKLPIASPPQHAFAHVFRRELSRRSLAFRF